MSAKKKHTDREFNAKMSKTGFTFGSTTTKRKLPPLGSKDDSSDEDNNPMAKMLKTQHNKTTSTTSTFTNKSSFSSFSTSVNSNSNSTTLLRPRASLFNQEDDKDDRPLKVLPNSNTSLKEEEKEKGREKEDDDPLDAFMANLEPEKPTEARPERADIEEEDNVDSYIKHMKARGIEIGTSKPGDVESSLADNDMDSDEEVYAVARAMEAAEESSSRFDINGEKKDIVPLDQVDHSVIDYIEFEKDFYEVHPDIEALSPEYILQLRRDLDMRVTGHDVPAPCISFGHFGFDESLMNCIVKYGYTEPTAIQKQAVPVALSGRDLIGIAKTGSGKTAAFLWPMLIHMMDQPEIEKGDGPIGLVLAPTRELAHQVLFPFLSPPFFFLFFLLMSRMFMHHYLNSYSSSASIRFI